MRLKDFKKNIKIDNIGDRYIIYFRAFVPLYDKDALVKYNYGYELYKSNMVNLHIYFLVEAIKMNIFADIQSIFWMYDINSNTFNNLVYKENLFAEDIDLILKPKQLKIIANEYMERKR